MDRDCLQTLNHPHAISFDAQVRRMKLRCDQYPSDLDLVALPAIPVTSEPHQNSVRRQDSDAMPFADTWDRRGPILLDLLHVDDTRPNHYPNDPSQHSVGRRVCVEVGASCTWMAAVHQAEIQDPYQPSCSTSTTDRVVDRENHHLNLVQLQEVRWC